MDDQVIVTRGGGHDEDKVTLYNHYGFVKDLPSLNYGRRQHGCGHYINTGGEMVNRIVFSISSIFAHPQGLPCGWRIHWSRIQCTCSNRTLGSGRICLERCRPPPSSSLKGQYNTVVVEVGCTA